MTKFEIEALERHMHLLDDMRLRAHRLSAGAESEPQPGTRFERADALQAAYEAVRDKLVAARAALAAA